MQLLGGLSVETFLRDYWQKRPLLIRQAFPGFESPLDGPELAGLACEEGVESRIVLEEEDGKPWQLHHGPFTEEQFLNTPATHWTLLVQGLDYWVPEVADLLESFRFIPNWRLDDIMASYAPQGGSVGPHYDQYDVFLLQGQGQRRWQVGQHCDAHSPRVKGTPLRILQDFDVSEEWILEPGDMLYLPPGLAHWGVALNDCITYSIGFRAPTVDNIVTRFSDHIASLPGADRTLADPDLQPQANPGEISTGALDKVEEIIRENMLDRRQMTLWFGQFTTEPKGTGIVQPPEVPYDQNQVQELVETGVPLSWNEGSRFAYSNFGEETFLFVDGERFILRGQARPLAEVLCRSRHVDVKALRLLLEDGTLLGLVTTLFNQGSLYDPC
ncbi:cupin domain-containing protein [Marinobacteraceae bacterium S3BR75-40.1]